MNVAPWLVSPIQHGFLRRPEIGENKIFQPVSTAARHFRTHGGLRAKHRKHGAQTRCENHVASNKMPDRRGNATSIMGPSIQSASVFQRSKPMAALTQTTAKITRMR